MYKHLSIEIVKLEHKNLVGLWGTCIQGDKRLLIEEQKKIDKLGLFYPWFVSLAPAKPLSSYSIAYV